MQNCKEKLGSDYLRHQKSEFFCKGSLYLLVVTCIYNCLSLVCADISNALKPPANTIALETSARAARQHGVN